MHPALRLALGPVGAAEVGAAAQLAALGTPELLDLLAHRRNAAAGLAADRDGADAQRARLDVDEARRLLRQVDREEGRGRERLRPEIGHDAENAVGARVGADGDLGRPQVHHDLRHRQAADEAPAHAEAVHDEVARPHAVRVETAGTHLLPDVLIATGEAHVGGAARGARGGLDLRDLLEGGGAVEAEARHLLEARAQLALLGEGEHRQVLEPRDLRRVHAGRGELPLVEHRVLPEVAKLAHELLELDALDLCPRRALDVVEEAWVTHARRSSPSRRPRQSRCRSRSSRGRRRGRRRGSRPPRGCRPA